MKKVLMITYSFPPDNSACARRAEGFAGQMHNYGCADCIITGDSDMNDILPAGTDNDTLADDVLGGKNESCTYNRRR